MNKRMIPLKRIATLACTAFVSLQLKKSSQNKTDDTAGHV
jgi:hypothetical protein